MYHYGARNWNYKKIEPFRRGCESMRLTCRAFSMLQSLADALFYDYNITVTQRSLEVLEAISIHPLILRSVHRIVFCRPFEYPSLEASVIGPLTPVDYNILRNHISQAEKLAELFVRSSETYKAFIEAQQS
jgi:hypothetical protein